MSQPRPHSGYCGENLGSIGTVTPHPQGEEGPDIHDEKYVQPNIVESIRGRSSGGDFSPRERPLCKYAKT